MVIAKDNTQTNGEPNRTPKYPGVGHVGIAGIRNS